jgi:phosphate uptake regulator
MSRIKLQQTGNGTFYVYLPRTLAENRNLKKGDFIDVFETETSILLSPVSQSWSYRRAKKEELKVSEGPEDLEWKIMSSYLSGILHARFQRMDEKDFSAKQITTANEVIQRLRGIESTINQKELEFVDVVDYENVNLYDEIKRMFKVLRAMLEQNRTLLRSFKNPTIVADSLHRHWTFEKEQTNPISFYIHRIVSIKLQFPDLFVKTTAKAVDCQHAAIITYILERIGDVIFGMANAILQIYAPHVDTGNLLAYPPSYIEEQLKPRLASLQNLLAKMEEPMNFFLQKNSELARMLDDSEKIVCLKDAKFGLNLRKAMETWRTDFDQEIVDIVNNINEVSLLKSIFPVAFRLRELSTYIESLSSRTCQFYYS